MGGKPFPSDNSCGEYTHVYSPVMEQRIADIRPLKRHVFLQVVSLLCLGAIVCLYLLVHGRRVDFRQPSYAEVNVKQQTKVLNQQGRRRESHIVGDNRGESGGTAARQ